MRNPWILLALATAALPWLFARRRRLPKALKTVAFPALFLLTTSKKKKARTEKRRQILLATLRSLALVSLTLVWFAPFESDENDKTNDVSQPTKRQEANDAKRVQNGTIDGRPIRVLIVDGSDSGEPFPRESLSSVRSASSARSNAAFYFATALNPTFDSSNTSQTTTAQTFPTVEKISSIDFSLLSASELNVFDAIFWVDLSAPTSDELEKTERFLTQTGKTLVVCAGPRLRIERWNELWKRWNVDATTVEIELDPATGKERQPVALSLNQSSKESQRVENKYFNANEFSSPFEKTPDSGIDRLPIWRLFPTVGTDAVPALRDAKSTAPVVSKIAAKINLKSGEKTAKNGAANAKPNDSLYPKAVSVFWVATVPDESVSALAFVPIFLPFAERIVEFAVADAVEAKTQTTTNERLNDSSLNLKSANALFFSTAIWGALAIVAALEFWLALQTPRRRRIY